MNIKKVLTKQIKFGRIGYDNDFNMISKAIFLPTRKVVKLVLIPKSAVRIVTNMLAVRPVRAISRVSQQGLRDYSYPEADHTYGFIGNINSMRGTDKQAA